MKFLVIQPHLDDAFFSITETALTWVEDGHEALLLTVFGGIPTTEDVGVLRHQKHITMWAEYDAAIRRGPFTHMQALPFMDDAARCGDMPTEAIGFNVGRQIRQAAADVIVVPTGIHHPDHRFVADLLLEEVDAWTYDELPYFAMHPNEALRVDIPRSGFVREGSRAHLAEKRAICRLFASQIGETEERCLWVPERVWRPR